MLWVPWSTTTAGVVLQDLGWESGQVALENTGFVRSPHRAVGTSSDPSAKPSPLTGILRRAPCAAWEEVLLLPSDRLPLLQESLDNLIMEGDNIVSAARKAIIRHDYSAVLTIFPILKHLKQMKPEFDQVLQVSLMGLESVLWLGLWGELFERDGNGDFEQSSVTSVLQHGLGVTGAA